MKQEETPEETYERVYREAFLNNTKPLKLWEICELYHKERKDKEIAELKENMQNISKGLIVEHHINIEKDREISALKEEVERLKNLKEPYIDRDRRTWEDCEYDSNGNHSPDCETCREK